MWRNMTAHQSGSLDVVWRLCGRAMYHSQVKEICWPCSQAPAQLFVTYCTEKSGEAWDNLSREWHQGREKGRENLIECGLTNRKYAAWSRLIEYSTVSCTETNGSHSLAVSSNSKCQECSILTCKRVVLAINSANFQRGHWMAIWMSRLAAGTILESLRIHLWTTIYYGAMWKHYQP